MQERVETERFKAILSPHTRANCYIVMLTMTRSASITVVSGKELIHPQRLAGNSFQWNINASLVEMIR